MDELVLESLRTDIFIKNEKKVLKDDEINTHTVNTNSNVYRNSLRSNCLSQSQNH